MNVRRLGAPVIHALPIGLRDAARQLSDEMVVRKRHPDQPRHRINQLPVMTSSPGIVGSTVDQDWAQNLDEEGR